MTGAEVGLVLGLVSSIIAIHDKVREIYSDVKDARNIPKAFRYVGEKLDLVLDTLDQAQSRLPASNLNEESLSKVQSILENSQKNAEELKSLCQDVFIPDGSSIPHRICKAVEAFPRSKHAKRVMDEILNNLSLLAANFSLADADKLDAIKAAMEELANLAEEDGTYQHFGAGPQNINAGNGKQTNNTSSGSGPQFNAREMHFGEGNIRSQKETLERHQIPISHPEVDLEEILRMKGKRTEKTCEWILRQESYTRWQESDGFRFLAIEGAPGTGKTILATFLVEVLRASPQRHFAFFFCSARDTRHNTALAILRGLLYQLARPNEAPRIWERVCDAFEVHNPPRLGIFKSFAALWQVFTDILLDPFLGQFVFLIDALNECNEKERDLFLQGFQRLQQDYNSRHVRLKLIITSRRSCYLKPLSFDLSDCVRMDKNNVMNDLESVIKAGIDKLGFQKFYPHIMKGVMHDTILAKSDGNFLWVSLALQQLSRVDATEALTLVQGIPRGLPEFFDQILRRTPTQDLAIVRFLLHFGIVTRRNFHEKEFALARRILLDLDHPVSLANETQIPSSAEIAAVRERIRRACPDLMAFDSERETLHIFHESVSDYLLQNPWTTAHVWPAYCYFLAFLILLGGLVFGVRSLLGPQNALMAVHVVLCYLNWHQDSWGRIRFACVNAAPITVRVLDLLPGLNFIRLWFHVDEIQAHFLAFQVAFQCVGLNRSLNDSLDGALATLQDYAVDAIAYHADQSHAPIEACLPLTTIFAPSKIDCLEVWLHCAARSGGMFIEKLVQAGANVDSGGPYQASKTPLMVAAAHGNVDGVRSLINLNAKINRRDLDGWTPLRHAVAGLHSECVTILVTAGADIDFRDPHGETALMSLFDDHVRLLDTMYADINLTEQSVAFIGDIYWLPYEALDRTTWSNHLLTHVDSRVEAVRDLLIKHTKCVDMQDSQGRTTLARAAKLHDWEAVLKLYEKGANFDITDQVGMNALLWALRSPRKTQIIRDLSLSDSSKVWIGSATIFYEDQKEESSLPGDCFSQAQSIKKMEAALIALIKKTQDLEREDFRGRTALSLAVENGYPLVVDLLLKRGARPDVFDHRNMSPLDWASSNPQFLECVLKNVAVTNQASVTIGTILVTLPKVSGNDSKNKDPNKSNLAVQHQQIVSMLEQRLCKVSGTPGTMVKEAHAKTKEAHVVEFTSHPLNYEHAAPGQRLKIVKTTTAGRYFGLISATRSPAKLPKIATFPDPSTLRLMWARSTAEISEMPRLRQSRELPWTLYQNLALKDSSRLLGCNAVLQVTSYDGKFWTFDADDHSFQVDGLNTEGESSCIIACSSNWMESNFDKSVPFGDKLFTAPLRVLLRYIYEAVRGDRVEA